MRQNHSRRAKRKTQKTLRRRYKLHRGAGSPRGSESIKTPEEELYDDAELLTTSPENPITSSSSLTVRGSRTRQNPMKWLGPFQKPFVGRIASAGISEMRGMTPRQREFIQNIATRKSFTVEMMKRLIENKLPRHSNKVAKYLAEVARKRVVSSLLRDSDSYVLDRVIMIGGPTTSTPYRWPHCMFLDPDGNIVVGSNTPYRFQDEPADRVQVFRYNDGKLLKSMCASTSEIGNIVFRDGFIIFPEGKKISFYNYSNGKMIQQLFKPEIEIYKGITVAPEGAMIMGFNQSSYSGTTVRIVRTDLKGVEIDSVYIADIDKAFDLCGLTFDQQGKLVVTLCSDEKIDIRIYDYTPYTPFNSKKPSSAPFISTRAPWKTIIFHSVNRPGMVSFDRNGNLLVTDTTGLVNIMKYPEGSLVQSIDCRAQSDTQPCTPIYVTAGHNGDILVCDKKNMCIKIFTPRV